MSVAAGRWIVVGLWLCVGCADAHRRTPELSESEYRAAFHGAWADLQARCCMAAGFDVPDGWPPDADAGTTSVAGLHYDPKAAGACIAWLAGECPRVKHTMPIFGPCDNVYTGDLALGDACDRSALCARGTDYDVGCGNTASEPLTRCRGVRFRPVGSACDVGDGLISNACRYPSRCDAALQRCVPAPGRGEPCEPHTGLISDDMCEVGSVCDEDTLRCVAPVPIGGACTDRNECEGFACQHDTCHPAYWYTELDNCDP